MSEVFDPNTGWFIGELVEEFKVAERADNLVHINTVLIKVDSPELAFEKALAIGESADRVFTNTEGVEVSVRFRGLRGLYPVYDRLEDGAELLYEERVGMSDEAIAIMVKRKEALAVFSPTWKDEESQSPFVRYRGIGNPGIGSGKRAIVKRLRQLRGE